MPEFHSEPYVYLAGLSHKSALIAWGAFYFRTRSDGTAKLVDDDELFRFDERQESIEHLGVRAGPVEEHHDAALDIVRRDLAVAEVGDGATLRRLPPCPRAGRPVASGRQ